VSEPRKSRDHTERLFRYFGIPVREDGSSVSIEGRPSVGWSGKPVVVPGDLSAAAFFIVGASLVPGSDVTITAVGINPTRTGILDILTEMGANIQILNRREEAGEPVADLRVRSAQLHGIQIGAERIPQTIDEFPILCVAAALAEGTTTITDAAELRVKESDRIATMAAELRKMGATAEETKNGLIIQGLGSGKNKRLQGATCASHGDHRVAMSMAIAGLTAEGQTRIQDTDCIETSFPGFESKLLELLTKNT
jgi:3-phosphoshikimate 1-carboxyvinyltransferase